MREVKFAFSTAGSGAMAFRTPLPLKKIAGVFRAAPDGQMGEVMRLYRDWQLSGDRGFLERL